MSVRLSVCLSVIKQIIKELQNRAGSASHDVSSKDVLEELGWANLKTQGAKHEATQMFKISTCEALTYLTEKISKVIHSSCYSLYIFIPYSAFMKTNLYIDGILS